MYDKDVFFYLGQLRKQKEKASKELNEKLEYANLEKQELKAKHDKFISTLQALMDGYEQDEPEDSVLRIRNIQRLLYQEIRE